MDTDLLLLISYIDAQDKQDVLKDFLRASAREPSEPKPSVYISVFICG
jgi:hypothetical protein